MRARHIVPTFVALTLMLSAVETPAQQERGRAFTLKVGESIQVSALKVTFRRVVADNRCRAGTMCITAGDAEITLEVEQAGKTAVISLHTMVDPKKTEWNGYTIQLVGLSGALRTAIPFRKQYRAEILVTR
jgi:hypothetical protein